MKYKTKEASLHPIKIDSHPNAILFLFIDANSEIHIINYEDGATFARCNYKGFEVWFEAKHLTIVE
jgi:hypothetical protein